MSDYEEEEGYTVPRKPGAARWVVGAVMLGLLGWTGFTLYERFAAPKPPGPQAEAVDERLERFLTEGRAKLVAGDFEGAAEQLTKASGIAEKNPRVIEGRARVELLRAEMAFWRYLASSADRGKLVDDLQNTLAKARTRSQQARGKLGALPPRVGAPGSARLHIEEQRLDAMLVYALALAGKIDEAKAVKSSHPEASKLASFTPAAAPADSAAPAASASASASAAASAPAAPTATRTYTHREDYELDKEPVMHGPSTKGELQLPP